MKRPNILLITSDQQHYSMLGSVNAKLKTPNLDKLAAEGMRFDRAYCPNPTCTPSRSSILTGMYPSRHGAWTLGTKLPEEIPTLTGYLRGYQYRSALIGKAHFQQLNSTEEYPSLESKELFQDFDFWKKFDGDFYGFDHVELLRNHTCERWVGQHYAIWMQEKGLNNWRDYFARPTGKMRYRQRGTWAIPEEYHYNAWIAERTGAMLEAYKEAEQPFFLWASFPDPHNPQLVPAPWDTMYDPADMELQEFSTAEHEKNPPYFREVQKRIPRLSQYRETGYAVHGLHRHRYKPKELRQELALEYGMVSFMDKYIGKILDKLCDLGLEEDTIVVFTTDHGDMLGQHGFRNKCIFHYEDELRIPMIARYPGHIPPATATGALQSLTDLAPTFLSYGGFPVPDSMQGVDQSLVWNGQAQSVRDHVIVENRHEPTVMNLRSYVDERYKITVHAGRPYGELYDLQADPEEHNNLWGDRAQLALKAQLLWRYLKAELLKAEEPQICYETAADGKPGWKLVINPVEEAGEFYRKTENSALTDNLWDSGDCVQEKADVLLEYASHRLLKEPVPMPRQSDA